MVITYGFVTNYITILYCITMYYFNKYNISIDRIILHRYVASHINNLNGKSKKKKVKATIKKYDNSIFNFDSKNILNVSPNAW